jgi:four helix bundle protein
MPRDPRKLRVFALADVLVPEIYAATKSSPAEERFGLVSQLRRAAVSVPANIVEGCGRRKTNDYLHSLNMAKGSAYELGYPLGLSARLDMMPTKDAGVLQDKCGHIAASLTALIDSLEHADEPDAGRPRQKPKPRLKDRSRPRV